MNSQVLSVLLVEDDVDYSALLRRRLMGSLNQGSGPSFIVAQASLLQEALGYVRTYPVDIIVLDLNLLDTTGLDTLVYMHQAAPQAAIIVLTGRDDQLLATQALRLGAQDYLVKGNFNTELLVRAIRYAVDRKQSEEALSQAAKQLHQGQTSLEIPPDLVHDFDSLLNKLVAQNSMALSELGADNPARIHVEKLNQTIHLVSALTRRLFTDLSSSKVS
ncbi:MAG: response regulator transcription factor [Caldilineaceae bacterium]|nr:response regulator transcription factor [Caldilineaceae bacterium]